MDERDRVFKRIAARQGTLECRCSKHRYDGKHPPRSACEVCWRFYIELHP